MVTAGIDDASLFQALQTQKSHRINRWLFCWDGAEA